MQQYRGTFLFVSVFEFFHTVLHQSGFNMKHVRNGIRYKILNTHYTLWLSCLWCQIMQWNIWQYMFLEHCSSCYHVLSTSSTNTPLHLLLSLLLLFYVHQQEVRHYICWGLFCFLNQLLNVKIQHINVDFTRT